MTVHPRTHDEVRIDRLAGELNALRNEVRRIHTGQPIWQDWTTTLNGITLGNGTIVSRYQQIGKLITARIEITFGSTTTMGTGEFTLPVTASTDGYTAFLASLGLAHAFEDGGGSFHGFVRWVSSTTARPASYLDTGTLETTQAYSATAPFTWGTGDVLTMTFSYEAA